MTQLMVYRLVEDNYDQIRSLTGLTMSQMLEMERHDRTWNQDRLVVIVPQVGALTTVHRRELTTEGLAIPLCHDHMIMAITNKDPQINCEACRKIIADGKI